MTTDAAGKPIPFEKDEEIEPDVAAWQEEVHEALEALPDGWERKFWTAFLQAAFVETTRRWKDGVSLGEADHSVWTEPMYSAARMALVTKAEALKQSPPKWSEMGSGQLLDAAEALLDSDKPFALVKSQLMIQAAQVQALLGLDMTIEHRLVNGITNAIWEGLRQR